MHQNQNELNCPLVGCQDLEEIQLTKEISEGYYKELGAPVDTFRTDMKSLEKRLGNGVSAAITQNEDMAQKKDMAQKESSEMTTI